MAITVISITVHSFRSIEDLNGFFYFWLAVLVTINIIGLWEILTGQHLPISKSNEVYFDHDLPTCVFRNPNDFATVLTLSVPFMITFISYNRKPILGLLGAAVLLSSLNLIIATESRANFIAVIIGTAFWFTFLLPARKKLATVLAAVLAVAILSVFPAVQLRSSLMEVGEELTTINVERLETSGTSLNVRKSLAKNALLLAADSFGVGVGAGNVEHRMSRDSVEFTYGITNVHNWWIEILANYGLVVFVGYVVFCVSLLAGLIKAHRNLTRVREKRICEALIFGLVAFPSPVRVRAPS